MKTLIFEDKYNVSIDDFEDTSQVDLFVEERVGKKLEVVDNRSSLIRRGGNIFKIGHRSKESIEVSIDRSMKAVDAQMKRLDAQK